LVAAGYEVFAINPMSVTRYRERHSSSAARSDAGDAHVLAEIMRLDRGHLSVAAYAARTRPSMDGLGLGAGMFGEFMARQLRLRPEDRQAIDMLLDGA